MRLSGDQCIYCGERANSDEHFPPASYGNLGFLLPACRECNSFAGTAHPTNFIRRVEHVKKQILSHAPRFTFTTDVTLHDILAQPESVWLTEMRAEKAKATYRSRYNWDAMTYAVSIQTRRYKFIPDFSPEISDTDDTSSEVTDLSDDGDMTVSAGEVRAERLAMKEAHLEELLESWLQRLPKFPAKRKEELLDDEDLEYLANETYFGRLLTADQFERILMAAREDETAIEPDNIREMNVQGLIELLRLLCV